MSHTFPSGIAAIASLWILAVSSAATAADSILTVGAQSAYTTLQSAVNACPDQGGCTILIRDSVVELDREVWIEGKKGLSLQPSPELVAQGIRPRIHAKSAFFGVAGTAADSTDPQRPAGWKRWPSTFRAVAGGALDTINPFSRSGFQYNGTIVVVRSSDIRIEGLRIQAGAPQYFVNKAIWDAKYDVLFGNVGVNLFQSLGVRIRDCEISGFFAGVYMQGRNLGGAQPAPGPGDIDLHATAPYSRVGTMGDHLLEGNRIHGNWWGVYDEMEWDLGSTFRFNIFDGNFNRRFRRAIDSSTEATHMAGGFLYAKDVPAIHRIVNNTIWGCPMVVGYGYYKGGVQHLFVNNVVGGFAEITDSTMMPTMRGLDGRQLLSRWSEWLENNVFDLSGLGVVRRDTTRTGISRDAEVCAAIDSVAPCRIPFDSVVEFDRLVQKPFRTWGLSPRALVQAPVGGRTLPVEIPGGIHLGDGWGVVDTLQNLSEKSVGAHRQENLWTMGLSWKSRDPGSSDYFVPDLSDSITRSVLIGRGNAASAWRRAGMPVAADVGARSPQEEGREIWGIHSQENVLNDGSRCWKIPLRDRSGLLRTSLAVDSVEVWSVPKSSPEQSLTNMVPRRWKASATLLPGTGAGPDARVCIDSTPLADIPLRFQLTVSGLDAGGTRTKAEPAYYLMDTPQADYSVGTIRREGPRVRGGDLRIEGRHLVAPGLGDGAQILEVRSLDGRVRHRIALEFHAGKALLDSRAWPAGVFLLSLGNSETGRWTAKGLAPR
ncbi:MAG: hypothetical protein H6686_07190 [Fibrobacteria bacterium]|nr:hypothetical protein [Fibrobacteria bacterium]